MSVYTGKTYLVPCTRGGWNANPNADQIPPESMVEAVNLNLNQGARETRGGTAKVNGSVITDGPVILGLFQFRLKSGSAFIVTVTSDGKIQKDYATTLHTGWTTNKRATFCVFKDVLYIFNGVNIPQTWDGAAASTSDMTNIPVDWTGTNYPTGAVVHGRGASERMWAYGCPTDPSIIYISANGSANFLTSPLNISIETGDGFGIQVLIDYAGDLIAIGKRRPYIIDDSSTSTANWGWSPAVWEGGVASRFLVVKTPNDLIAMNEDGEIYSVIKAQALGDFRAVSLTRPAHIDVWIRDNVDLAQIADFHMQYDPALRAIKIFVIRIGETKADVALTYFIDRPAEEAWTKHRYYNQDFCASSALVRVSAGVWNIYTGGHTGFVYKLESSTKTDNGAYYYSGFTTPEFTFGDPRSEKQFDNIWFVLRILGAETIKANIFVDGAPVAGGYMLVDESGNEVVDESGNQIAGYEFNPFSFTVSTPEPLSQSRRIANAVAVINGFIGRRIQIEVYQDTAGEGMFVSQMQFDHTTLGAALSV